MRCPFTTIRPGRGGPACIWKIFLFARRVGRGIGKALLIHLAQIAVRENCGRFVWAVLDWNQPSIDFYESLGAKVLKEWLTMRVEGDALQKLAQYGGR